MKTTIPARTAILLFGIALSVPALAQSPAAEVVSVQGKGEFRQAQEASWRPAQVKQSLFPSNYVRTGDTSRMAILFKTGFQQNVGANSQIQILEAPGAGQDSRTLIRQDKGRSWGQSKDVPRGVQVQTPAALAAIRGTDWEIVVDDDGRATLSVFSGEVEFSNEHGRVLVARNEQATAEKGKAPVKLQLRTSRKRIQWVSSATVDPSRHAGPGAALLVRADTQVFDGDLAGARATLERGAKEFPADMRFPAALSRLAFLDDEPDRAVDIARGAVKKDPSSAEALLALGDAERLDGRAKEAAEAYAKAIAAAANDARGYQGLGIVEGERENVRRARGLFEKAISLDPANPTQLSELGTLESFAGDFARAKELLEKAVAAQPDHYVAWTGLGVLALKTGDVKAAHEALLRATLIEPRYARAHLYLAATWYEQEKVAPALESLRRAAELDPNDPMPYLLASIIHVDRIEYGEAAAQSREALARLPYLKSLNQVADNQKGIANVGTALASLGLEAWSRSLAQQSYLPFWGGSHLFLADRYPGAFNKRSELIQGFITDPIAFGASNRFQSLFASPGHHATVSLRGNHSDDLDVFEPVLTLNGYVASPAPMSYFAEAIDTRVRPGNVAFDGRARTVTAAFGVKPTYELSAFVYATHMDADVNMGTPDVTGEYHVLDGKTSRIDAGLRYAFDADTSLWLKGGASREDSSLDTTVSVIVPGVFEVRQLTNFVTKPKSRDAGARLTANRGAWQFTAGLETARLDDPRDLVRWVEPAAVPTARQSVDQTDRDRLDTAFAHARWQGAAATAEVGLAWREYTKDRDIVAYVPGPVVGDEAMERRGWDPALGFTWKAGEKAIVRGMCRRWLRPNGPDTLAPIAVAGIPLDDQVVLGGGELEQCGLAIEWTAARDLFVVADAGESRVENVISFLDGVQNTRSDLTNLDRLRNRIITPPAKYDLLEDVPVYAGGRIRRAHVGVESIVAPDFAVRAHYTFADTENDGPAYPGNAVPWIGRHTANVGFTWTVAPRVFVTALATWRSQRYSDEANLVAIPKSWDGQLTVFAETPDKRWSIEAYALNLGKKEASDVFGAIVSYRF